MIHLTQQQIDDLIVCPKEIIEPPRKADSSLRGSHRNDFRAVGPNGEKFHVFMRQSDEFQEDFSVGIRHILPDGQPIILMRCNGPHGDVMAPDGEHWHFGYHIHLATQANLERGSKPERGGVPTEAYATYDGALRYLLDQCRIEWTLDQFPWLRPHHQIHLAFPEDVD